jgi:hypothetical protein
VRTEGNALRHFWTWLAVLTGWLRPRGRPGEIRSGSVFCPLVRAWIGSTTEIEVSGNRTLYDSTADGEVTLRQDAADFNEAAREGGWKLPDQLLEAVTLCQFCEAYCLGKTSGPDRMPKFAEIDRSALMRDLYGGSEAGR